MNIPIILQTTQCSQPLNSEKVSDINTIRKTIERLINESSKKTEWIYYGDIPCEIQKELNDKGYYLSYECLACYPPMTKTIIHSNSLDGRLFVYI